MAAVSDGERRVRRMAEGDSTQRSRLDADQVTSILREQGEANLRAKPELELVLDGMELRLLSFVWGGGYPARLLPFAKIHQPYMLQTQLERALDEDMLLTSVDRVNGDYQEGYQHVNQYQDEWGVTWKVDEYQTRFGNGNYTEPFGPLLTSMYHLTDGVVYPILTALYMPIRVMQPLSQHLGGQFRYT